MACGWRKKLTRNPWGPDSPYLNRAAAAKGDTSLIDTLTFATLLFPATETGLAPPPGKGAQPLLARARGGVVVRISGDPGYRLRLHDLRGAALPFRAERTAEGLFVPDGAAPAGGVLSLWKAGRRIEESVLGNR